ncbi:AMP-binding protein [Rhodococcus fascians]|uniref:AMP-binding protein n=1 Tax=Rhodococcoides fascians TaxID=1828 RepID=UPI0024B66A17|nr:AMP-binding protein [Rhodococcus fascians]MDJ0005841.1 AMP-binding protein [Rhodococcus fascians]
MTLTAVQETLDSLRQFGDLPALESSDSKVTYKELADAIDKLAARLSNEPTIGPGAHVLVSSRHVPQTIVIMLACVKANVAYVPVPPDAPETRVEKICSLVQPAAYLQADGATVNIDLLGLAQGFAPENRDDILAILHTSGSTGTPKSVLIEHSNLDHFMLWCRQVLPLTREDRVAVLSPLHFDLCTHDIFHGLHAGATLVIPDEHERTHPGTAGRLIATRGITRIYMVPTFLERVATSLVRSGLRPRHVRCVMFAGERLTLQGRTAVEEAFPRATLHNLYGPIETNVVTALELQRGAEHDSSEVGRALPGVELGIRHPDGTISTEGRGELTISGPAVTPGYLDELHNAQKFIVAPTGERTYRTGDEATLSPDGVYLHGRLDSMVKIRGQRVELDEIEAVLLRHDAVDEGGVVLSSGGDELHAFIVLNPDRNLDASIAALVEHCRAHLPAVAVPGRIRTLAQMPVTGTGKIDRQSLKGLLAQEIADEIPPALTVANTDPERAIEEMLSARLQSSAEDLRALSNLREHPAFNSLIAAQVVEAVEDLLDCSADYDRFTARSFDSITSMGELFVHRA